MKMRKLKWEIESLKLGTMNSVSDYPNQCPSLFTSQEYKRTDFYSYRRGQILRKAAI